MLVGRSVSSVPNHARHHRAAATIRLAMWSRAICSSMLTPGAAITRAWACLKPRSVHFALWTWGWSGTRSSWTCSTISESCSGHGASARAAPSASRWAGSRKATKPSPMSRKARHKEIICLVDPLHRLLLWPETRIHQHGRGSQSGHVAHGAGHGIRPVYRRCAKCDRPCQTECR